MCVCVCVEANEAKVRPNYGAIPLLYLQRIGLANTQMTRLRCRRCRGRRFAATVLGTLCGKPERSDADVLIVFVVASV